MLGSPIMLFSIILLIIIVCYYTTEKKSEFSEIEDIFVLSYAVFSARFWAFILDILVIIGVFIILMYSLGLLDIYLSLPYEVSEIIWLILDNSFIIILILGWIYYAVLESSELRATFGKKTMGLIVTDLNADRISFGRAFVRHFCRFLSIISFGTGILLMLNDDKNQTFHDKLMETLVLKDEE